MSDAQVLLIDLGGNNVKLRLSENPEVRKSPSGLKYTPQQMIDAVKGMTTDWHYDRISIGVPAPVADDRMILEPHNLGPGWKGFDFSAGFGTQTKVVNDAAMQALGSYDGGKMLFLGLGTGLGASFVVENIVLPLEIAHMPYKRGWTYEDCVATRGFERMGLKRWMKGVWEAVAVLRRGLLPHYIVIGGGHAKKLDKAGNLPPDTRIGSNANAFTGGLRLWHGAKIL